MKPIKALRKRHVMVVVAMAICWSHAFTSPISLGYTDPCSKSGSCFSQRFASLYIDEGDVFVDNPVEGRQNFNGASDTPEERPQLILPSSRLRFSPYHILYPDSFAKVQIPAGRYLPLDSSLRLLMETLETLIEHQTAYESQDASRIIRIEHQISHSVDPLCWLQAQSKSSSSSLKKEASIYFATADGALDAAAFGSVKTFQGTVKDETYWDLVDALPEASNLYGGQRFDVDSQKIGSEWAEFSQGFWMLPAIELRREQPPSSEGFTDSVLTPNITIALHLYKEDGEKDFSHAARRVLQIIAQVSDDAVPATPPTTLPPVLSRASTYCSNMDGQDIYEKGVTAAIQEFDSPKSPLEKVVLARRMDLSFGSFAEENVNALDILRRWKFGNNPGGHLFYIRPSATSGEFFGCTPERLFQVRDDQVLSEALAGTRPRGSTQEADEALSRQLFGSTKDKAENEITGNFILNTFREMEEFGWTVASSYDSESPRGSFFVRRLRHLQHICQRFQASLADEKYSLQAIKHMLTSLHPTPAVGGYPKKEAMEFIREYESVAFDRGFYAGPVGYLSKDSAELVVAIRSGLVTRRGHNPKVSVFAGAGLVPGSTVQGEWAETSYKLAVVSSIFPQSPITLQRSPTPNAAWATAFVEELIRNGITQFYICPGSRSTPFVAAIAKAARSNVNTVRAISIHDERGAAFRALGYGRGSGKPAAVITSSGTAVANLYPAVVEAGMDGVPMLVLTADRPYENRNTGANQAIDQVQAFSSTYLRWFRDILPPSDDVPVTVALSDAAHAVQMSREQRGPVHVNVQFRENLAPDRGPIRNDNRLGSTTQYNGIRFTDSPGFQRWSIGGEKWLKSYLTYEGARPLLSSGAEAIAELIARSKRGIIVVGNLRKPSAETDSQDLDQTLETISTLAQMIGFPIFAGAQAANLRFISPAVIPYSEFILRYPPIRDNLSPDLVLQFGAPLVSTEIPAVIKGTMNEGRNLHHVLIHPHFPSERHDPEFTVTHRVDADISVFTKGLLNCLESQRGYTFGSDLAPLVTLGKSLRARIPTIVQTVADTVRKESGGTTEMMEPEIFIALSRILSETGRHELSLFLSNSMPVRDAELFLYPNTEVSPNNRVLKDVGVNRGASGIDGIIASAAGFCEATGRRTTLVMGDVAALHDVNSLHGLRRARESNGQKTHPLTTIVINNDGGGIFSFLPISQHGSDVAFEEFFGTPTNTFSFEKGAEAFGIPYEQATNSSSLAEAYVRSIASEKSSLIEAIVAGREQNVAVHKAITKRVNEELQDLLESKSSESREPEILPMTHYGDEPKLKQNDSDKVLVLLHGWMGDKSEWDTVGLHLAESLPADWSIISLDLPGHGESRHRLASEVPSIMDALSLNNDQNKNNGISIDEMASTVAHTLLENDIQHVDALAGYSLGGRVALAMKRMCLAAPDTDAGRSVSRLLSDDTKMILISTNPGDLRLAVGESDVESTTSERLVKDYELSQKIRGIARNSALLPTTAADSKVQWSRFLQKWYGAPLWGDLTASPQLYRPMVDKRVEALSLRAPDLAAVLYQCSPPKCRSDDWRGVVAEKTLFLCGSLDTKYSRIGDLWRRAAPALAVEKMPGKGHALLIEAAQNVAGAVKGFLISGDVNQTYRRQDFLAARKGNNTLDLPQASSATSPHDSAPKTTDVTGVFAMEAIGSIEFEAFSVGISDNKSKGTGIKGIGWGKAAETRDPDPRKGFIIQVLSKDGTRVGIGEVSPLAGLHLESLEEADEQLNIIAGALSDLEPGDTLAFEAGRILCMDGAIAEYLVSLSSALGVRNLLPSVRSGLEMAILSLASQTLRMPIHRALAEQAKTHPGGSVPANPMLALNGLITRGSEPVEIRLDGSDGASRRIDFESWKVKIGHQRPEDDASAISYAFQMIEASIKGGGKMRADANRGFDAQDAERFANALEAIGQDVWQRFEYIEEPLKTQAEHGVEKASFATHVDDLERFYSRTGTLYALDETLFDLTTQHEYEYDRIAADLEEVLAKTRGCAALILKPSLLGLELSFRLARLARKDLAIGAVFTSSFDSGVGLSFVSFLASLSDGLASTETGKNYAHGLGTFCMLDEDCLSPAFESYVNQRGVLNVASLSRAFYGLGLDEIKALSISPLEAPPLSSLEESILYREVAREGDTQILESDSFEASTATSSSGREITLFASLPLPFSADIACARFTDLPQQPRWSPWISSVAYVDAGGETEWTLRVRGVTFRWRAMSSLLEQPNKGIRWESKSGLKNTGVVEFIDTSEAASLMKVTMAIVVPRIVTSLFKGTSIFLEDFLRNKILKWSLEMFRDVVKGDLALEEGNAELGDALFGAVEGKASAIEATLSLQVDNGKDGKGEECDIN